MGPRRYVAALLVGVWVAVSLVVYARGCGACSCERTSLTLLSASGTPAFVGSFLDERPLTLPQGDYRVLGFRVLETLRGSLGMTVEVRTGAGGGRCGIELTPGEEVVVVVYAVLPGLVTEPCSAVDPERLRSIV